MDQVIVASGLGGWQMLAIEPNRTSDQLLSATVEPESTDKRGNAPSNLPDYLRHLEETGWPL